MTHKVAIGMNDGRVGKVHTVSARLDGTTYTCGMSVYESDITTVSRTTCEKCLRGEH